MKPDLDTKEPPKRADGVTINGKGDEIIDSWLTSVPDFSQLWQDIGTMGEDGNNPDAAAVYGCALMDIGPARLVAHARSKGWSSGIDDWGPLAERAQLRDLIEKADDARQQRIAEHYASKGANRSRRDIPETFRQKWGGTTGTEGGAS